jgi:hypothetical protein
VGGALRAATGADFKRNTEYLVLEPGSPSGGRLPVRLKACLIGEVEVLFRYTLSGL